MNFLVWFFSVNVFYLICFLNTLLFEIKIIIHVNNVDKMIFFFRNELEFLMKRFHDGKGIEIELPKLKKVYSKDYFVRYVSWFND